MEHADGTVDLSGLSISGQWLEDFAPNAVALAADGCGNSWSVDLGPESRTWGPVYYFCHDPPVIVYQFPSAAELLQELHRPPSQSDLGDILRDWSHRIYRMDALVVAHEEAIRRDRDPAEFATTLGAGFHYVDLRNRFGPETQILRHSRLPLVAVRIPAKETPWWRSIFGSR